MTDRMLTLGAQQFRDKFFSEELRQNKYLSLTCRRAMQNVEKEALYFPIPESDVDKSLKVSFVDTWHMERNYGGKRVHEGTDIMAAENKRGLYPVVSVSDGVGGQVIPEFVQLQAGAQGPVTAPLLFALDAKFGAVVDGRNAPKRVY